MEHQKDAVHFIFRFYLFPLFRPSSSSTLHFLSNSFPHQFAELVSSESPVKVDGRVQGWDLSAEGIVQTASNSSDGRVLVFTGSKNFIGEIFYGADFDVMGLVNGVDLGSVCPLLDYHHFHTGILCPPGSTVGGW